MRYVAVLMLCACCLIGCQGEYTTTTKHDKGVPTIEGVVTKIIGGGDDHLVIEFQDGRILSVDTWTSRTYEFKQGVKNTLYFSLSGNVLDKVTYEEE